MGRIVSIRIVNYTYARKGETLMADDFGGTTHCKAAKGTKTFAKSVG